MADNTSIYYIEVDSVSNSFHMRRNDPVRLFMFLYWVKFAAVLNCLSTFSFLLLLHLFNVGLHVVYSIISCI